jgi:hypothetical protein
MKAWSVHVVFATILVGSLAARGRATDVLIERGNLEPAILRVARSHGLAFREYETISDTGRRALVFEAPGCAQPMRVVLRTTTLEEEPFEQLAPQRDYVHRYVYIERTWDQPNRLAVWIQRMKYEVLGIRPTAAAASISFTVATAHTGCRIPSVSIAFNASVSDRPR